MRKEWKSIPLAKACTLFTDGDWIETKDQSVEGIRLIQTGNVGIGEYKDRESKARFISEATFSRLKCQEVFSGDCLVSRLPDPVGRSCIIPATEGRLITSVDCTILRFSDSVLLPEFFNYYSQSTEYLNNVESYCTGATRKRISRSSLGKIEIPLPLIAEQKRVVAILDEAFAGIATAIANTEKNLANARELFESYLNSVFSQRDEGWKERKLGDSSLLEIIDGDRGVNYPKKSDFREQDYCLFMNTKNVRPDGFKFDSLMFITKDKDNALGKGKLKRRDVVLTTRGTIGNLGLYDESVMFDHVRINSGMLILRPNEQQILSDYLFEIMRSSIVKSQIDRLVSGAAQPQLPIKTLVNISLPVPLDLEEQKKLVFDLREIEVETTRLDSIYQQKLAALIELKQSLLQKAFSGELTGKSSPTLEAA